MTNVFIVIVIFLALVTLVQIVRVGELLDNIRHKNHNLVTPIDNKRQSFTMVIVGVAFLISCVWQYFAWNPLLLPPASSEHGTIIDELMRFTMILIISVFFMLHIFLFYFLNKYKKVDENHKAYYYTHNNKLEYVWTIFPAIILTGVILYGLSVWNQITNADTSQSSLVEIYAKQFGWNARYPGVDNSLGKHDYKLVEGANALGIDMDDEYSLDDKVTRELHLVVGKPVLMKLRSQDIIHSAFMPHFRVQMNCVPGMTTQFAFTPTKTTAEMKKQEGEDFEYVLLCNKICGVAHYNMQMKVVVETQAEFDEWMSTQKTLSEKLLTQK